MKVIFLDVDGVLNHDHTKETIEGFSFVSDEQLLLLKKLVDNTGAKLVLSSTWRRGWYCKEYISEPDASDRQDIRLFDALCGKLHEVGLELLDYTDDFGLRGTEIEAWIQNWSGEPIESFVILDDMDDLEMAPYEDHLVQTCFSDGLQESHVQKATNLLNSPTAKEK